MRKLTLWSIGLGSVVATIVAASVGCKDPAPAPTPSASAAPVAATEESSSTNQKLALSKPGGTTPVDLMIEKLQATQKTTPKADNWTLLGRYWIRKARESSDPGFYLNAKACADLALELAPQDRAATNLVAMVFLNDHKFLDAKDVAGQILSRSPVDMMALGTLSDAENELGNYDAAVKAIDKMMDLKPNLPSYIRSSYVQWLRGDIAPALESARLAADAGKDPTDPEPRCWALVSAAMIFWGKGDYAGADKGFDLALNECKDYPPALVGRGRVALGNGEFAKAVDSLDRAHKLSPLVETAWLLGDAKAGAGDAKGAEDAYAMVVKHGRQTDGRTLALFYATHDKEHDEAVKLAEAEKKVRDDLWTEDAIAWASYRAGKLPAARAASDKAIALGTKDARLLYHAGAIRIAQGEKEAGEKLVKDALKLNPKFDLTAAAEAQRLVEGK